MDFAVRSYRTAGGQIIPLLLTPVAAIVYFPGPETVGFLTVNRDLHSAGGNEWPFPGADYEPRLQYAAPVRYSCWDGPPLFAAGI